MISMSRNSVLGLFVALGLYAPAAALAQLVPPARSAGAGNAPISRNTLRTGQSALGFPIQRDRQRRKHKSADPAKSAAAGGNDQHRKLAGAARACRDPVRRRFAADRQPARRPAQVAGRARTS